MNTSDYKKFTNSVNEPFLKMLEQTGFLDAGLALIEEFRIMANDKLIKWREEIVTRLALQKISEAFLPLFQKTFPAAEQNHVIQKMLLELKPENFKSLEELTEFIHEILMRQFYSAGERRVYDANDRLFFDLINYNALKTKQYVLNHEWTAQFIKCLLSNSAYEDIKLHILTPDWVFMKAAALLMNLYEMTGAQLKKDLRSLESSGVQTQSF